VWYILITICLYIVYYTQGMGLPSKVRFFKIKKGLWVFRALITVLTISMALTLNQQGHPDLAQFYAMFALANSLALPYKRNAVPNSFHPSLWENLKLKVGFSIGSAVFLLIVSFIAFKVAGFIGGENYWYFLVIIFGAIGLHSNESVLSKMYTNMNLGDRASVDIEHRNKILRIACMAYVIGGVLIASLLFTSLDLQFRNWTGWSGLLFGAIIGGLLAFD